MPRISVILPTYNEVENITPLIPDRPEIAVNLLLLPKIGTATLLVA